MPPDPKTLLDRQQAFGMLQQFGVALDNQGNVRANTDNYQTSLNQVFTADDIRRGQCLLWIWLSRLRGFPSGLDSPHQTGMQHA
jgi:NADPH-dependent glutamate synthase beta subunit-like oxidoreductase